MLPDTGEGGLLITHGALVLLVGVLAGYPYWVSLVRPYSTEADRGGGDSRGRGWRVAHATLIQTGLVMLAAGLLAPQLSLSPGTFALAAWSLVASGWGFTFAMVVGAALGVRGLTPVPPGLATVLFVGHVVGATGATIGVGLFAYGLVG